MPRNASFSIPSYLDRVSHPPLGPFDPRCPRRQIIDRIADKWTVLIVVALEPRAKRFGELRREIGGISAKDAHPDAAQP
jgi:DNA-binding HxlR family transcriptional regulator